MRNLEEKQLTTEAQRHREEKKRIKRGERQHGGLVVLYFHSLLFYSLCLLFFSVSLCLCG